eukprot:gb/GECG01013729.1/.p1 GENE.gb/GECG01013729.1/~~gb/GECG01013729.1/.p1  ORF type:complete len:255 (+),score=23.93 gb/GECG01013729.1/:1-765(+)
MSKHRPEHTAPPDLFYNEEEAEKYTSNSRMIHIQSQMTQRCLELLALQNQSPTTGATASAATDGEAGTTPSSPKLLLDVGCGSGLSGSIIEEAGHFTVGVDISKHMLEVGRRSVSGDLFVGDIGQGFGFRAGMFDGAISVSALQWLCYSDKKEHKAHKRLSDFFQALYRCLRRGARAALQFYPESPEQIELITTVALKSGFSGGLVVDYPNSTKAKKYFLCLSVGRRGSIPNFPRRDRFTFCLFCRSYSCAKSP